MESNKWDESAAVYRSNVENISFYKVTNQRIVTAANIQPGMTVIDLACGSGVTTRLICEALRGEGKVFAIDSSASMLVQARRYVNSGMVSFLESDACVFSYQVTEKVDLILCNAAFWHFSDPPSVLEECRKVLKPKGRVFFNLPDQEFDFGDGKQSQMSQTVAKCLNQPLRPNMERFDRDIINEIAEKSNFEVSDYKTFGVDLDYNDLIAFYSIPHVSERRFPELPYNERVKIIESAFSKLDKNTLITYRWAQFCLKLMNDS